MDWCTHPPSILCIGIAERPAGTANGLVHVGERNGDGVGGKGGLTEVEEARQAVLVEGAKATTQCGLAIAEQVVGEAHARHELFVLVRHSVDREVRVTREHHAGGQSSGSRFRGHCELGRALVSCILGGAECGLLADIGVPGSKHLPTHAIVQCEAAIDLPTVLSVDGREVVALVHQLIFALGERG